MIDKSPRSLRRSRPRPASGRFVLRLDPAVHETLRAAARSHGLSLNDYCSRRLAAPAGGPQESWEASTAIRRALTLLDDHVVGVVVFGSWARGVAADTSDVDVLIVVGPGVALTRDLYRQWDSAPVTWNGRPVEPHFVHMADDAAVTGGVWAEAALDGLVVFERQFEVSMRLVRVRHQILSGRLVRRVAHGQPYWSEVS